MCTRDNPVLCSSVLLVIFGSHILVGQGPEVIVLIAEHNGGIYRLNTTDNSSRLLYTDVQGAENVAWDPVPEHIYWSNLMSHWINRIQLNGTGFTNFIRTQKCQGLVVDPILRMLFYSDDSARTIKKNSLITNTTTLVAMTTGSARPHDLVADFKAQLLYWSVLGDPRIETSDYNGRNRKTLIRTGSMRVPTSLALDETGTRLYWIDEHPSFNDINAFDLLNQKSTIVSKQGTLLRTFSVDVFNTILYVIDRDQTGVYITLSGQGGKLVPHRIPQGMSRYRHIRVFSYLYECPVGRYGRACDQQCGQCEGRRCERDTGHCPEGCAPGWTRITCSEVCPEFTYGPMCMHTCGFCGRNASCSKIDGRCPAGCSSGWIGDRCLQDCLEGFYGDQCSRTCGHCSLGQTCRKSSGQCSRGCEPGWSGDLCLDECPGGFYGIRCNSSCGQCGNNTACNSKTGQCPFGCKNGWEGEKCTEKTKEVSTGIIVLGVLLPIVLLACILVIVVLIKKRRELRVATADHHTTTPVTYAVMDEELQKADANDHLDFDKTNDTAALFQL